MNFSLEWFTTVPGLLITGGVLLLIVALIILIVTTRKAKKEKILKHMNIPLLRVSSKVVWDEIEFEDKIKEILCN